ncbi:MAG: hypothetical protein L0216_03285 [Planctomycetales bacterium]|nr:hypothetical protein [Planctomycetales bacterium]
MNKTRATRLLAVAAVLVSNGCRGSAAVPARSGEATPAESGRGSLPDAGDGPLVVIARGRFGDLLVSVSSPGTPTSGDQPVTIEADVNDAGGGRAAGLSLSLSVSRDAAGDAIAPSGSSYPMGVCPGCGAYRADVRFPESGRYAVRLSLEAAPGDVPRELLRFALDVP